ncbi:hypothetical protein AVEN_138908-1 [Araneus ventricosus]|uniref:Uncharacterized protein n=1 Tax=Araneus ventricosus TaxID=182803 RepID=A0A4Y2MYL2_ARAVE|nr:hypothetical protein AVEN_138908-1 [Araneus ventricosus]
MISASCALKLRFISPTLLVPLVGLLLSSHEDIFPVPFKCCGIYFLSAFVIGASMRGFSCDIHLFLSMEQSQNPKHQLPKNESPWRLVSSHSSKEKDWASWTDF